MRDQLLDAKATAITEELERWAREHAILRLGERIIFTMHIEGQPIVIRGDERTYLNMSPQVFFSKERFIAAGCTKSQASRNANAIKRTSTDLTGAWFETMEAFLRYFPDALDLVEAPHLGIRSARKMVEMIRLAGLDITDTKNIVNKT